MKRSRCLFTLGIHLLFAAPASSESVTLEPVVVTATRVAGPAGQVALAVTVITDDEIAATGALRLEQALRNLPSVEVTSAGPAGALATASIRGSEASQVLVLLDGVRLNTPQNGQFSLSDLPVPLKEIERIEVVRGPTSALYGGNAVGGVIQIFTRRPEAEPRTSLAWTEGAHDTRSAGFSTARQAGPVGCRLTASQDHSLGYRDNSNLNQTSLDGLVSVDLPAGFRVEGWVAHLDKEIGVPGSTFFPSPEARQRDQNTYAALTLSGPAGPLHLTARGACDHLDNRYQDPGGFFSTADRHRTETLGSEIQADAAAGIHTLTMGGEVYRDFLNSTTIGKVDQGRWAAFGQDEIRLGPANLVFGLRYDGHSDFGDEWSPRVAVLLSATGTTRLRASVGRAYRPPTLNDRFWPDTGYAKGNPNLQPETAVEVELGLTQQVGQKATLSLSAFRRDAKDLIEWQPENLQDPASAWTPVNVGKARIWGAESSGDLRVFEWLKAGGTYTYLHPKDLETGDFLIGKPRHQAGAYAEAEAIEGTRLRIAGRYERFYPQAGRNEGSYTVFDASITRAFFVAGLIELDASLGIRNLLDRSYEVSPGYPMPSREWYAGLTATL